MAGTEIEYITQAIMRYSKVNPMLNYVISREARRVVTLKVMKLYPVMEAILCEFYGYASVFMYITEDRPIYPKLVRFLQRFGAPTNI